MEINLRSKDKSEGEFLAGLRPPPIMVSDYIDSSLDMNCLECCILEDWKCKQYSKRGFHVPVRARGDTCKNEDAGWLEVFMGVPPASNLPPQQDALTCGLSIGKKERWNGIGVLKRNTGQLWIEALSVYSSGAIYEVGDTIHVGPYHYK
ncbi:hypothetical protein L2E82_10333 [Cichorium intybus]|uniref:Uncharacterized protein n=1 Tax=Cichorium intybus TaxID=13427 RepID=A0ACB9G9R7_CICIN|nr:hypothetical protein L2E82_10333 [Cichorium intybus]